MKRKQNKKNWIPSLLLTFLGTLFFTLSWSSQANASQLNFSVEPTLPENQYESGHTYFDLLVQPGQIQELEIKLSNDTEKDVTVISEIHPATTNLNGVVEYGTSDNQLNDTAKVNLKELLQSEEQEIVVPAKGETLAKFHLTVPEEEFEGLVAGGITLKEKEEGEATTNRQEKEKQGLAIENKYAYVVAAILREADELPKKSLELVNVEADQVNARNVINAELKNPQARYLNNLQVATTVKKKNSNEVLYSTTKDNMQMAPNTSFQFPTTLGGKKLEAGEYILELKARSGDDSWSFKKDFHVTADKAEKLNSKDISIPNNHTHNYLEYYVIFGIGFILILIAIFLIYFLKKNKRKEIL